MLKLETFLNGLLHIGSTALNTVPELASIFEAAISTMHQTDQPKAKEAYQLYKDDNDAGHAHIQTLLRGE